MASLGIRPTPHALAALLRRLVADGHPGKAAKVLADMLVAGGVEPGRDALNVMLTAQLALRDPDAAEAWLRRLRATVEPDVEALYLLACVNYACGRPEAGERWVEELILRFLGSASFPISLPQPHEPLDLDHAVDEDVHDALTPLQGVESGRAAVVAIQRLIASRIRAGFPDHATALLARLTGLSLTGRIPPSTRTLQTLYNTAVEARAAAGDVDGVLQTVDAMTVAGLAPDAHTHASVVVAYARQGGIDAAEAYLRRTIASGVVPAVRAFNALMLAEAARDADAGPTALGAADNGAQVKDDTLDHVEIPAPDSAWRIRFDRWCARIRSAGLVPDGETYAWAFGQAQRNGGGVALYRRMRAERIRPTAATFRAAIPACTGDLSAMLAIARDMARRDLPLGPDAAAALLAQCRADRAWDAAADVLAGLGELGLTGAHVRAERDACLIAMLDDAVDASDWRRCRNALAYVADAAPDLHAAVVRRGDDPAAASALFRDLCAKSLLPSPHALQRYLLLLLESRPARIDDAIDAVERVATILRSTSNTAGDEAGMGLLGANPANTLAAAVVASLNGAPGALSRRLDVLHRTVTGLAAAHVSPLPRTARNLLRTPGPVSTLARKPLTLADLLAPILDFAATTLRDHSTVTALLELALARFPIPLRTSETCIRAVLRSSAANLAPRDSAAALTQVAALVASLASLPGPPSEVTCADVARAYLAAGRPDLAADLVRGMLENSEGLLPPPGQRLQTAARDADAPAALAAFRRLRRAGVPLDGPSARILRAIAPAVLDGPHVPSRLTVRTCVAAQLAASSSAHPAADDVEAARRIDALLAHIQALFSRLPAQGGPTLATAAAAEEASHLADVRFLLPAAPDIPTLRALAARLPPHDPLIVEALIALHARASAHATEPTAAATNLDSSLALAADAHARSVAAAAADPVHHTARGRVRLTLVEIEACAAAGRFDLVRSRWCDLLLSRVPLAPPALARVLRAATAAASARPDATGPSAAAHLAASLLADLAGLPADAPASRALSAPDPHIAALEAAAFAAEAGMIAPPPAATTTPTTTAAAADAPTTPAASQDPAPPVAPLAALAAAAAALAEHGLPPPPAFWPLAARLLATDPAAHRLVPALVALVATRNLAPRLPAPLRRALAPLLLASDRDILPVSFTAAAASTASGPTSPRLCFRHPAADRAARRAAAETLAAAIRGLRLRSAAAAANNLHPRSAAAAAAAADRLDAFARRLAALDPDAAA
ncbi:hypothetical protein HK405_007289, partial [Cladochytrium tenue]